MLVYVLTMSNDRVWSIPCQLVYVLKMSNDRVWSIPCLFMIWQCQLTEFDQYHASLCSEDVKWQSLVNTMPVYVLTMSTVRVWSIPCLFMFWRCQLTEIGQYHASLCSNDVNCQSLVYTMPVHVLTMSTDRDWSIVCLFMIWRCQMTWQYHTCSCDLHMSWSWPQVVNIFIAPLWEYVKFRWSFGQYNTQTSMIIFSKQRINIQGRRYWH